MKMDPALEKSEKGDRGSIKASWKFLPYKTRRPPCLAASAAGASGQVRIRRNPVRARLRRRLNDVELARPTLRPAPRIAESGCGERSASPGHGVAYALFVSRPLAVALLLGPASLLCGPSLQRRTRSRRRPRFSAIPLLISVAASPKRSWPTPRRRHGRPPCLIKGGFIVGAKFNEGSSSPATPGGLAAADVHHRDRRQRRLAGRLAVDRRRPRLPLAHPGIAAACRGTPTGLTPRSPPGRSSRRLRSHRRATPAGDPVVSAEPRPVSGAGVAIDGAAIQVEQAKGAVYYAPRPGQPNQFRRRRASASSTRWPAATETSSADRGDPAAGDHRGAADGCDLGTGRPAPRAERVGVACMLAVIDGQWRQYLSLPNEVFTCITTARHGG